MGRSGILDSFTWEFAQIEDGQLEVTQRGRGEPVVIIQTALTADEFLAIGSRLAKSFHVVLYHRRGYAGSSRTHGTPSIAQEASDCLQLCEALALRRVHLVGGSFSSAVALNLAADVPGRVHSISLIEAPPTMTASRDEFLAACSQSLSEYKDLGATQALDRFLGRLIGPDWRRDIAVQVPDGVAAVERDADAFFSSDIPALMAWEFGDTDVEAITQPLCYVGGTDSGPWFDQTRDQIKAWFPTAHFASIQGADHSLALRTPTGSPQPLLTSYRHPMGSGSA